MVDLTDRKDFPDGMIGTKLEENFGDEIDGSTGQLPGTDSPGAGTFAEIAEPAGFDGTGPFVPESYDAAALIMLAGDADGGARDVLDDVVAEHG